MVHLVSIWTQDKQQLEQLESGHQEIFNAANKAYNRVSIKTLNAIHLALVFMPFREVQETFIRLAGPGCGDPSSSASFYRGLYREWPSSTTSDSNYHARPLLASAKEALADVLKNKLVLDRRSIHAGDGKYHEQFLCAEVNDLELPWDVSADDW